MSPRETGGGRKLSRADVWAPAIRLYPANGGRASQPPGARPLRDGLSRRVCTHPAGRMLPQWPSAFGLTDRGNYSLLTRAASGIAATVSGVKAAASGVP
jgi:hypothetical protein